MSDVVLFEELKCRHNKKIAVITLNSEKSLNALSHEMILLITPRLVHWQQQTDVVAVLIQGAGDKAFCAGGDIVNLYNNLPEVDGQAAPLVEEFFSDEYQLDYLIHHYHKPIIVWGNGIVMGGGLGLMAGASHRIVTETTRIAMPEVSIGLYPDVGGSYFLNKMPNNIGLFLGLTAAPLNASDAQFVSLADYFIAAQQKPSLIESLTQVEWLEGNHKQQLEAVLQRYVEQSKTLAPAAVVEPHQALIAELTKGDDIVAMVNAIVSAEVDDKWFNKAQKTLARGSALSVVLTYHQLRKGQSMSLADCLRMELTLSTKCAQFGEFKEGVRALLIDKDNCPAWRYADVDSVDDEVIDWFFTSAYSDDMHPLARLA